MKDFLVGIRNSIFGFCYRNIVKRILFLMDPEVVHEHSLRMGMFLGSNPVTRGLTKCCFGYSNKKLEQHLLGISFSNPIGLAAGFDKDALLTGIWPAVGFGFAEVGSITGEPCKGNPKPRVWRLPESKSLVIHYGLKNKGAVVIAKRLRGKRFRIPVGISVAKTNCKETVPVDAGIADYVEAYRAFTGIGAYTAINISCPNAFGGEPFTDAKRLDRLLAQIDKIKTNKPVFLKVSPDLSKKELGAILKVANKHTVHGFICTNLTKKRTSKKIVEKTVPEKGGLSGKIVEDLATEMIAYIHKKTNGTYVLVGCGGVFSAEDAYKKIKAGASLIQMITGMIFEGPQLISEINRGLVRLLERDGLSNIAEAIGRSNS